MQFIKGMGVHVNAIVDPLDKKIIPIATVLIETHEYGIRIGEDTTKIIKFEATAENLEIYGKLLIDWSKRLTDHVNEAITNTKT